MFSTQYVSHSPTVHTRPADRTDPDVALPFEVADRPHNISLSPCA